MSSGSLLDNTPPKSNYYSNVEYSQAEGTVTRDLAAAEQTRRMRDEASSGWSFERPLSPTRRRSRPSAGWDSPQYTTTSSARRSRPRSSSRRIRSRR